MGKILCEHCGNYYEEKFIPDYGKQDVNWQGGDWMYTHIEHDRFMRKGKNCEDFLHIDIVDIPLDYKYILVMIFKKDRISIAFKDYDRAKIYFDQIVGDDHSALIKYSIDLIKR